MARIKKSRVPISKEVAASVLFASDRTCCVCREPGKPVQLHHIDEDSSNSTVTNLAALCLHCHDATQVKGGFARRLDAVQVTTYRDDWHGRVASRRDKADEIAVQNMSKPVASLVTGVLPVLPLLPVKDYITQLPGLLRRAYIQARPGWAGSTGSMMDASYQVIDLLAAILSQLGNYYPAGHFDGQAPADYVSEVISSRFRWHRYHMEPSGEGTGGTIVGPSAASGVINDLENMVVDLVTSLLFGAIVEDEFDLRGWIIEWRAAAGEEVNGLPNSASPTGAPGPTCPNCSTPSKPMYLSPMPADFREIMGASHECTRCHYRLAAPSA